VNPPTWFGADGDGSFEVGSPVEHLDLATVIRVSQAASGEIVRENLIDTLMRTAMAHAGRASAADSGARD
jgi:hypothetical protein